MKDIVLLMKLYMTHFFDFKRERYSIADEAIYDAFF